jgi:hypothetical protein
VDQSKVKEKIWNPFGIIPSWINPGFLYRCRAALLFDGFLEMCYTFI